MLRVNAEPKEATKCCRSGPRHLMRKEQRQIETNPDESYTCPLIWVPNVCHLVGESPRQADGESKNHQRRNTVMAHVPTEIAASKRLEKGDVAVAEYLPLEWNIKSLFRSKFHRRIQHAESLLPHFVATIGTTRKSRGGRGGKLFHWELRERLILFRLYRISTMTEWKWNIGSSGFHRLDHLIPEVKSPKDHTACAMIYFWGAPTGNSFPIIVEGYMRLHFTMLEQIFGTDLKSCEVETRIFTQSLYYHVYKYDYIC